MFIYLVLLRAIVSTLPFQDVQCSKEDSVNDDTSQEHGEALKWPKGSIINQSWIT